MTYADIKKWNQQVFSKSSEAHKYTELSNALKKTYTKFNDVENYLSTGLTVFGAVQVGNDNYKEKVQKVKNSINSDYNSIVKIQEAADKKAEDIYNEIASLKTKIKNEKQRLQKLEQQRKEEEAKRIKEELQKKKENPLKGFAK